MDDLTPEELEALKAIARREIAWRVVRGRVRNRVLGIAAIVGAVIFMWDKIRELLMWIFR
jgi:hypothetical protein